MLKRPGLGLGGPGTPTKRFSHHNFAEQGCPRKTCIRIRHGIVDARPKSALKPDRTNDKIPVTVTTTRNTPMLNDSGFGNPVWSTDFEIFPVLGYPAGPPPQPPQHQPVVLSCETMNLVARGGRISRCRVCTRAGYHPKAPTAAMRPGPTKNKI